jgi:hypothetical protein
VPPSAKKQIRLQPLREVNDGARVERAPSPAALALPVLLFDIARVDRTLLSLPLTLFSVLLLLLFMLPTP